jgi:hypothetical protein
VCSYTKAYLLWDHRLALALLIGLIPSPIVSMPLLQWADLEGYKASRFGQYI